MNTNDFFVLKDLSSSNIPDINIVLYNNSVYFVNSKTLIINDIHLGFESALTRDGIFVPSTNVNIVAQELDLVAKNMQQTKAIVEKVVINGDIKHSFSDIDKNTKSELDLFFDTILQKFKPKEIIVVKGNHDTFLNLYMARQRIKFVEEYKFVEKGYTIVVTHGHKKITLQKEFIYIIGHEHPAVGIRKGSTYEQYKCFLFGTTALLDKRSNVYPKTYVIVMPSFTNVSVGSNIFKGVFLSPIMTELYKENEDFINDWDIIVNENSEFYTFKGKELKEL